MKKSVIGFGNLATLAMMAAVCAEAGENGENNGGGFASGPNSASGRIKVAEKDYDAETGSFSITFADGSSAELNLDQLSPEIVKMLALHGLSQKLGDSYASVKGDVNAAKTKFQAVVDQLLAGEWKKAREAGEGGSKVTELAEAIATLKTVPIERANAVVAKASKEQLATWRGNAAIKAEIAKIRARKAAERADAAAKKAGEGASPADELAAIDLDAVEAAQ